MVYLQLTILNIKDYYLSLLGGKIQDNIPELLTCNPGWFIVLYSFYFPSADLCYAVVIATRRVPSVCLLYSLSKLMTVFSKLKKALHALIS